MCGRPSSSRQTSERRREAAELAAAAAMAAAAGADYAGKGDAASTLGIDSQQAEPDSAIADAASLEAESSLTEGSNIPPEPRRMPTKVDHYRMGKLDQLSPRDQLMCTIWLLLDDPASSRPVSAVTFERRRLRCLSTLRAPPTSTRPTHPPLPMPPTPSRAPSLRD